MTFFTKSFRHFFLVFWLAVIAFLSLMPGNELPQSGLFSIPHLDKLVHAGMYGILAILTAWSLKNIKMPISLVTLLLSLFYGAAMEILQAFWASHRSGSWGDLLADLAGAIMGLLLIWWVKRRTLTSLSNHF